MSVTAAPPVVNPDRDGQPMADNTLQFQWISTIKFGNEAAERAGRLEERLRALGVDPNDV